jgi:uncharacterized membrane protein
MKITIRQKFYCIFIATIIGVFVGVLTNSFAFGFIAFWSSLGTLILMEITN